MTATLNDRPDWRTLIEFIKEIKVCMFSTLSAGDRLHSRPMYTYPPEKHDSEVLWVTTDGTPS